MLKLCLTIFSGIFGRNGPVLPQNLFPVILVKFQRNTLGAVPLFLLMLIPSAVSAEFLTPPPMTENAPAAGERVRQVAPEYDGTEVYHTLYLPSDWKPGRQYPVMVEYTGNHFPACGSTGEVKDANLGYGLTGGEGFIWVSMPYIEEGGQANAIKWWGDRQLTVDYCKRNLPRICAEFGGDLENIFLCGFSRGSIALSYIGLADDEIAGLWKGFIGHDHFDGEKEWPYPASDRASALKRLQRLKGRPVLLTGAATRVKRNFLEPHLDLARFTFLDVRVAEIYEIPEGKVIHPHTDHWMAKDSAERRQAWAWLQSVLEEE